MSTARPQISPFRDSLPPSAVSSAATWSDTSQVVPLAMLASLVVGLVVAYRDMFEVCVLAWGDDQYSHGWLIPVFTLVMLWSRREFIETVPSRERWIGVGLLVFGIAVRIVSGMFYMVPLDMLSFLASLFGVFVLIGGLHILRWAGPWLGFLIFMFPLPSVLEHQFLWKLKGLATAISVGVIQTLGFATYRAGNVITIGDTTVEVADVCSGLRMATIFIAMSVAIVLVVKRPWWDKLAILVSAVPIALCVNIIRITATAIVYWAWPESDLARRIVHDGAGYAMPILALGMMWLVLTIMEHLSVVDEGGQVATVGRPTRVRGAPRMPIPK